jgi:hypothetical protein
MKKFNKHIITTSLVATALFSSCSKDFLNREPYTQVSIEATTNTPATMANALNGAYAGLLTVNMYGRTLPIFGDLLADNVFVSVVNSGYYIPEHNYSVTINDADVSGLYADSYSVILRANNIINSSLATDAVNQSKGEAYALRALNYFNLVRYFAKPYTDAPNSPGVVLTLTYNPSALLPRSTVAQVYTQIIADLDKAYSLMSEYKGSGYFSKYAARALQAKVYLTMGDYQKAFDAATDVINNSGFTLMATGDIASYYAASTTHGPDNKVETLFEVASDQTNSLYSNEILAMYLQSGSYYGQLLTTGSLYNLYSGTDGRKSTIIAGARPKKGGEDPAYIVNKYQDTDGPFGTKKIMRMGEVYLIAAEAGARLNNPAGLTYLNALMAKRDPAKVYASAGTQLINDIITERRKELAFEGDRFLDLNRLKAPIDRTAEYPTGAIPFSDYRRVLPIPQSVLNVNPNVEQNPGYNK